MNEENRKLLLRNVWFLTIGLVLAITVVHNGISLGLGFGIALGAVAGSLLDTIKHWK
jgi:hypothetical protein